jgi:type I restriction-modification system DNA methylase subunit
MGKTPDVILQLVENFGRNLNNFKSQTYNEAQVRQEFINPFFETLGWDMQNKSQTAAAYKDVIHEDAIKVGGSTKAPDYCFRIGGTRKFFVEAKKPSVNIKSDISPAYQLRRYAWNAKLPLSILTDFEEFAVYDCWIRPNVNDKPSTARIFFCGYKEYGDKWEQIAKIFSKEAVYKGLFDKYASEKTTKRGTTTVDKEFLAEIEGWRNELAKNIAIRNSKLSVYDLNFAVQKTIDRILFLRICEDRAIERNEQLLGLINGNRIYPRLFELFEKADEKYNSGIFHFRREKDRPESPDEMSANLKVDDDVLKKIIRDLYYPCPYEFSIMPAEILGNVYEQFLGKVIRLTASHQAKVEEKPEVKKAGGVYYTPSYIVDYIVKNTVGKLCEGKTPKQIEKLKILDPACGSGSFLIGAYQYLLDYHRDYYIKESAKHRKQVYQGKGGLWFLTIEEKKRILLNNIFGVDIDSQAVEVTKLSLLLKVLENETQESLRLFHERALPDLGNNIKCGNSLIGPDFYQNQQLTLFGDEQQRKINAFDWQKEFAEIFAGKTGGFDAVIGNPPYIPTELMADHEREYYRSKNPFLERKYDTAVIFIASMLEKLNSKGLLSFISSVTWQTGQNYSNLRKHIFSSAGISHLVNLPFDVFENAYVDTGIYVISREPTKEYFIYQYPKKFKITDLSDVPYTAVNRSLILSPDYKIILNPTVNKIMSRCSSKTFTNLGRISISTQGLSASRFEISTQKKSKQWFLFLEKGQVYRYFLQQDKTTFANLSDKQSLVNFYTAEPKILIRRVISRQDRLLCAYFNEEMVFKKDINPFVIIDKSANPFFVLGILNSRLFSHLYINTSSIATKDDFRQTTLAELREMPIPIYLSNKNQQNIISLVEVMLELTKKLAGIKNEVLNEWRTLDD